jgi:outer membrane protein assembly factor BamB
VRRWLNALVLAAAACSSCARPPRAVEHVALPPPKPQRAAPAPVRPPAAALERVELHPVPLDVESLPAPSAKWSHVARAWALARDAGLVLVIEPGGRALAALDTATGLARWTRRAPGQARFSDVAAVRDAATPIAAVVERVGKKHFVARVRLRDGRLGARTRLAADATLLAGEHGGLALVDRVACRARLWNAETGHWAGSALSGSVVELKDFRGWPAPTCRMTVAAHALAHGVSVASYLESGRAVLAGFDASGEKWRLPLGGDVVKSLTFEGDEAVFAGVGIVHTQTSLVRVDLATGRVAWRRDANRCATQDPSAVRMVSKGAILVDGCGAVQVFDAASGARVARREVVGTPVVIGEAPSWIHVFKNRPPRAQWLDENGKLAGRIALPPEIVRVEPLAGGLLAVSAKQDVVALLERDGRARWQYRVEPGRVRVEAGRVVLLGARAVAILDPESGHADAAPLETPWLVGHVASPSLWLFAAGGPSRVVAF